MVEIEEKVVAQLRRDGIDYRGCLYGGFMLTKDGPKVLEFNARFGDPETQVVLPRMEADLVEAFLAVDAGTLDRVRIGWSESWAVSVVLTSAGYPGPYEKGRPISGIQQAEELGGVTVYHAGTALAAAGQARDGRRARARRDRRRLDVRGRARPRLPGMRAHRLRGQDLPHRHWPQGDQDPRGHVGTRGSDHL